MLQHSNANIALGAEQTTNISGVVIVVDAELAILRTYSAWVTRSTDRAVIAKFGNKIVIGSYWNTETLLPTNFSDLAGIVLIVLSAAVLAMRRWVAAVVPEMELPDELYLLAGRASLATNRGQVTDRSAITQTVPDDFANNRFLPGLHH